MAIFVTPAGMTDCPVELGHLISLLSSSTFLWAFYFLLSRQLVMDVNPIQPTDTVRQSNKQFVSILRWEVSLFPEILNHLEASSCYVGRDTLHCVFHRHGGRGLNCMKHLTF